MKFLQTLEALKVRQAVLTGRDGLLIDSVGRGLPEPEFLAAEVAALAKHMGVLAASLGGEVRRFTLATEDKEVLVVTFSTYCLGAVLERGMDRKAVGSELSRLALRLADQLG